MRGRLLVLAVSSGLLAGCSDRPARTLSSSSSTPSPPSPPATASASPSSPSSSPSRAVLPDGAPASLFGARDGAVVEVSTATGRVLRTLYQPVGKDFAHTVAVAPDGAVWFSVPTGDGGGEVRRVLPGGEGPERVMDGCSIAFSRDGGQVATTGHARECGASVTVRDLRSGASRVYETSPDADLQFSRLAWTWDGRALLVVRNNPEEPGGLARFVPGDGSPNAAPLLGPAPGAVAGTGWQAPASLAAGRAYVVEACCALDANSYYASSALLTIDDATGAVHARVTLPADVASLDLDPSGEHVLFADWDGVVRRLAPDGSIVRVAQGMQAVAW